MDGHAHGASAGRDSDFRAPDLDSIAKALKKAKRTSSGWTACCPAHDDHDPSLTLAIGDNGAIVVKCHGGCDQGAVIAALKARNLWPEQSAPERKQKPKVVATYDYRDEYGGTLFRVVRYEPKNFKQCAPDGKGGWSWSIKGVRQVPFRLPETLEAIRDGRTIYIPEGEKDALALVKFGLDATCNAGGAGKWRPEFADHFRGADVVILPDNDQVGRDHAAMVARSLSSVARRVRVATLPGLPPKGDISDWLAAGGTAAELEQIADATPTFDPDGAQPNDCSSVAPEELAHTGAPERRRITATPFVWRDPSTIPRREWLYGRHLIRKFLSLTVAPGAAGKTSLLIASALAMVTARNIIGQEVWGGPKRIWLWNLEDPREEIERRIVATMIHYRISADDIGERLFLDSGRDSSLRIAHQEKNGVQIVEPVIDELVAELLAREIDVLIVDPFVSSHQVSENDNGAIDLVAKTWGKVAERANCAVELVHHVRKTGDNEINAESARGAISLVAAARSCNVLNRMTRDESEKAGLDTHRGYFRIIDDKNNLAPPCSDSDWFHLESVDLSNGDSVGVVVPWKWPNPLDDITVKDLIAVQNAVSGKGYRVAPQSKEWVGFIVGEVLGWDVTDKSSRDKISALLKIWLKSGALKIVEIEDEHRKKRRAIDVGAWATTVCASAPVQKSPTGANWRSDAKRSCASAPVAPVPPLGGTGTGADWSAPAGDVVGDDLTQDDINDLAGGF